MAAKTKYSWLSFWHTDSDGEPENPVPVQALIRYTSKQEKETAIASAANRTASFSRYGATTYDFSGKAVFKQPYGNRWIQCGKWVEDSVTREEYDQVHAQPTVKADAFFSLDFNGGEF